MTHIFPYRVKKLLTAIFGFSVLYFLAVISFAQEPVPLPTLHSESPELFPKKYDGETTQKLENLWDGVDDENDIHVLVGRSSVLNDVGRMVGTPFPPSPNFVDINNDKLKDLIVGDSGGFIWIYLNSGKKGEPKFTTGTFLHTFAGWASRIHVADWDQDGDYDIIIGTFYGDIAILENWGTIQQYHFIRKMGIPRYVDPRYTKDKSSVGLPCIVLKDARMPFGIYMSPWVADWTQDGKPDLILGEGTYSANSVQLAVNVGPRGRPTFVKERLFYLAYGEGYEQLTPSVVDYNGDGLADLLVGTRTGEIRLHKGTEQSIKPEDMVAAIRGTLAPSILKFDGFLKIEGKEVFDKMSIVYPCDWNEDGLFDLLIGSTTGKILLALNQGTKKEPSFPKVQTIKGTNIDKDLLASTGWSSSIGDWRWAQSGLLGGICNSALLLSAEKEIPAKTGFPAIKPVAGESFLYFRYIKDYPGWNRRENKTIIGARNICAGSPFKMIIDKRYEFSFHSILRGKPATWRFNAKELVEPGTDTRPPKYEHRIISDNIIPSSSWQKRTYKFKCQGTHKTNALNFHLLFALPEGDCTFMLDNFSLKEITR